MKNILKISLTSAFVFSVFLFAHAQSVSPRGSDQITFPIASLGNCASQVECKAYCDKAENITACTAFADEHHLITPEDKQQNQKFADALKNGGPGGCTTFQTCKTYCDSQDHAAECLKFAQDHGLKPKGQLDQTQNVDQTLKTSGGPGGCKTTSDCKTYCSQTAHQQECVDFGKKHGLVKPEDTSRLDKFQSLVKAGQTPGGCATTSACEAYCKDTSHKQECLDFAVKLGALTTDQSDKIKETGNKGPGGCNGKDACDAYCKDTAHQQECLDFANQHGLAIKGSAGQPENIKDCLIKVLGADVVAQLDTKNLTADQKAAIAKCRPLPDTKPNATSTPPHLPGGNLPAGSLKECLVKVLGADAVANLDTSKLTAEQKTAIAKCLPKPPGSDGQKPPTQSFNQSNYQSGDSGNPKPPLPPPPGSGDNHQPPPNLPPPPPQGGSSGGSGNPSYQYQGPSYNYESH